MELKMKISLESSGEPLPIDIFRVLENKIGSIASKILNEKDSGQEFFENKNGPNMIISWETKPSD